MDIRNFFGGGGATKKKEPVPEKKKKTSDTKKKSESTKPKPKKNVISSDDDDVIVVPSPRGGATKKKEPDPEKKKTSDTKKKSESTKPKPKKNVISSDDDEVIVVPSPEGDAKKEKSKKSKEKDKKKEEKISTGKDEKQSNEKSNGSTSHKKKQEEKTVKIESDESFEENNNIKEKKGRKRKKESTTDDDGEDVIVKARGRGKKCQRVLDSDSEEDPLPKKEKKSSRKKRESVLSDSDEEDLLPKKEKKSSRKKRKSVLSDSDEEVTPKKPTLDKFFKSPQSAKPTPDNKKAKTPPTKQAVNVADFFGGSTPVQRVERKVPVKRKIEEEAMDLEMHDDDDFEQTLQQLDEQSTKTLPVSPTKKKSPEKQAEKSKSESPQKGSSLSSRLSNKMKQTSSEEKSQYTPKKETKTFLVKDTPQKTSPDKNVIVPDTPDLRKAETVSPVKRSPTKASPVKTSPAKTSPVKGNSPLSPHKGKSPVSKTKSPDKTSPTEMTPSDKRRSYRSYLNREGPSAPGSKEIPQGADNCLEGLTFVITGVLDSLERDEAKSLVEKYGGKVTQSVSKRTSYMVVGQDAGQSKMAKATQFNLKQIDEDGMLQLIRDRPGKRSKYEIQAEQSVKKEASLSKKSSIDQVPKISKESSQTVESKKHCVSEETKSVIDNKESSSRTSSSESHGPTLLWVDKYKPSSVKQIIGQQGDKSNAKKLFNWLRDWHKNRAAGTKPSGKFFGKDETGGGFRAALLSGPPGVGKTTTATLVCQEAGFSYVEQNASDTRNKKSLQHVVAESLNNETLVDFMGEKKKATNGHKHCLIMDEVDGMAGNQDRGGLQEIVSLIKQTKIPVICICNDRNSQKMRTLSNYTFDLRFSKPRAEQIKAAVMSIAYKEGLKIPPPALNEIISGANQDIRQVIHNISMWSASDKSMTYEQAKADSNNAKKDFKLGPFDVCRKVFVGGEETRGMSVNDKSDLFFHDYSFSPLFVQENYIHVQPYSARGDVKRHLSCLARAAHSISDGDLVDKQVRSGQQWNLLPTQAIYASVIPGEHMRGNLSQMVNFPSWLGKNSSRSKTDRILQELNSHMALQVSGDKRSLNLEYLPFMRYSMTDPIVRHEADGVPDVISLMDEYDIIKEDFDNIMEITKFPNSGDPLSKLSSKTKAAFTRAYNKSVHLTPYSTGTVTKKRRGKAMADTDDTYGEEGEGGPAPSESEEETEDLALDTMIKAKKKTADSKGDKSKAGTSGKGKGQGKGTAKKKK